MARTSDADAEFMLRPGVWMTGASVDDEFDLTFDAIIADGSFYTGCSIEAVDSADYRVVKKCDCVEPNGYDLCRIVDSSHRTFAFAPVSARNNALFCRYYWATLENSDAAVAAACGDNGITSVIADPIVQSRPEQRETRIFRAYRNDRLVQTFKSIVRGLKIDDVYYEICAVERYAPPLGMYVNPDRDWLVKTISGYRFEYEKETAIKRPNEKPLGNDA